MSVFKIFILGVSIFSIFSSCKNDEIDDSQLGGQSTIKIAFNNKVSNQNFVLGTNYINSSGEQYKLTKFNYYISNVALIQTGTSNVEKEKESYHLISANDSASTFFQFNITKNSFNTVEFYVGVDSLRNVSGAQTGALDPLNGMFWTWNSGYIMAKMEGTSPASTELNNAITYHIGGYSGPYTAIRKVTLTFPNGTITTNKGGTCSIKINVDINKWFNGVRTMKIADGAFSMVVNDRSSKFADNYATMFSIESITNY